MSSGLLLSLKSQGGGGLNPLADQSTPCSLGLLAGSPALQDLGLGEARHKEARLNYPTSHPPPSNLAPRIHLGW